MDVVRNSSWFIWTWRGNLWGRCIALTSSQTQSTSSHPRKFKDSSPSSFEKVPQRLNFFQQNIKSFRGFIEKFSCFRTEMRPWYLPHPPEITPAHPRRSSITGRNLQFGRKHVLTDIAAYDARGCWAASGDKFNGTAGGGGGVKWKNLWNTKKKPKINSVGWQHTRVDNNKTNKAQASRFCSTASH